MEGRGEDWRGWMRVVSGRWAEARHWREMVAWGIGLIWGHGWWTGWVEGLVQVVVGVAWSAVVVWCGKWSGWVVGMGRGWRQWMITRSRDRQIARSAIGI